MAELWAKAGEMLGGLAAKWTGYAAVGSFLLYLFGYLVLRYQLSVYGVSTSIDAFDEKYLFAGCRFLVYLVSTLPNLLILVILLAAIGYIPLKLVPVTVRARAKQWVLGWSERPVRLSVLGIAFSVLFIQFVQRRCFVFVGNILLAKRLPDLWIKRVFLSGDGWLSVYFIGLVAGTLLSGAIWLWVLQSESAMDSVARGLRWLLGFLFAVEVLFLPINYGILISTHSVPRVAEISGDKTPPSGSVSWLLWEGKDALTYLVRDAGDERTLVTVPSKDAPIRTMAYDDIICVLFGAGSAEACQ